MRSDTCLLEETDIMFETENLLGDSILILTSFKEAIDLKPRKCDGLRPQEFEDMLCKLIL